MVAMDIAMIQKQYKIDENDEEKLDVQDELRDRFGKYPEAVNNLI